MGKFAGDHFSCDRPVEHVLGNAIKNGNRSTLTEEITRLRLMNQLLLLAPITTLPYRFYQSTYGQLYVFSP